MHCLAPDGQDGRFEGGSGGYIGSDLAFVLEGKAYIIQAFQQSTARVGVDVEVRPDVAANYGFGFEVHGDFGFGGVLEFLPDELDVVMCHLGGQEPLLAGLSAENARKPELVHRRPDEINDEETHPPQASPSPG